MLKYYFEVTSLDTGHLNLTLFSGDEIIMCKKLIYNVSDNKLYFNGYEYSSESMNNFIRSLHNNELCRFDFSCFPDNSEYITYFPRTETMTFHSSNDLSITQITCNIDRDTDKNANQFATEFEKVNRFVRGKLLA